MNVFVIVLDKTKQATLPQLSLLQWNRYHKIDNIFPTSTFNIDTAKYGTNFEPICMIGFHKMDVLNRITPHFEFDLSPTAGIINGIDNSNCDVDDYTFEYDASGQKLNVCSICTSCEDHYYA